MIQHLSTERRWINKTLQANLATSQKKKSKTNQERWMVVKENSSGQKERDRSRKYILQRMRNLVFLTIPTPQRNCLKTKQNNKKQSTPPHSNVSYFNNWFKIFACYNWTYLAYCAVFPEGHGAFTEVISSLPHKGSKMGKKPPWLYRWPQDRPKRHTLCVRVSQTTWHPAQSVWQGGRETNDTKCKRFCFSLTMAFTSPGLEMYFIQAAL